jgi:hypothetical protein
MCVALDLSVRGYYASRFRVGSPRVVANRMLFDDIRQVRGECSGAYIWSSVRI